MQSPPLPTTRHDPVCALPTARHIGYRDVARAWASMHALTAAHSHGTLYLQHFVTFPTTHDSENYSKHTSLIHDLSLVYLFVMHA